MDQEQIKKIVDSPEEYADSKEDSLLSVLRQLYGREMHSSMLVHGGYILFFLGLAVFCGLEFFRTEQIQFQIMYATIFISSMQFVTHRKTVYWQVLHRNSVKREIKRLELRIAQLSETVGSK